MKQEILQEKDEKRAGLYITKPVRTAMRSEDQHAAVRSNVGDIARRAGVSVEAVRQTFSAILEEVSLGRTVAIDGFGKFRVGMTGARTIETPIMASGIAVQQARRCIRFNQARSASRRLNEEQ